MNKFVIEFLPTILKQININISGNMFNVLNKIDPFLMSIDFVSCVEDVQADISTIPTDSIFLRKLSA